MLEKIPQKPKKKTQKMLKIFEEKKMFLNKVKNNFKKNIAEKGEKKLKMFEKKLKKKRKKCWKKKQKC